MTLPTLQSGVPIVDGKGAPTEAFLILWQQAVQGLANSSGASMPAPSPVTLYADYTGAYLTGQLPKTVQIRRLLDGADVSLRTRWFLSTVSGAITASIDQGGAITIAAMGSNSVLQVKSVRDNVSLYCNVSVNRSTGAVPSSGASGGATASSSTLSNINSSSYAVISPALSVIVGASGNVSLSAPLAVSTGAVLPAGTFPAFGKWQWYNGAVWVDVAAEIQSSPDCVVNAEPRIGVGFTYIEYDGTLTVNMTQTALTPGATAKFQLLARNGSGTRTMTFSGTAAAAPQ